jgi:hypothetical protein
VPKRSSVDGTTGDRHLRGYDRIDHDQAHFEDDRLGGASFDAFAVIAAA